MLNECCAFCGAEAEGHKDNGEWIIAIIIDELSGGVQRLRTVGTEVERPDGFDTATVVQWECESCSTINLTTIED